MLLRVPRRENCEDGAIVSSSGNYCWREHALLDAGMEAWLLNWRLGFLLFTHLCSSLLLGTYTHRTDTFSQQLTWTHGNIRWLLFFGPDVLIYCFQVYLFKIESWRTHRSSYLYVDLTALKNHSLEASSFPFYTFWMEAVDFYFLDLHSLPP